MRRILAIDGGGIKGVFPAAFLARLEELTGRPVASHFDLIAGTSTGGIIAIGLGLGLRPQQLVEFYLNHGPEIFHGGHKFLARMRQWTRAKYTHDVIERVLTQKWGERTLGDSRTRLMIPTLNLSSGRVQVFKTAHHPSLVRDWQERAVDVALATVSAPSWFPAYEHSTGAALVDGSLWARNPVGSAVVEAVGLLDWPRQGIRALSLGCTSCAMSELGESMNGGAGYWSRRITTMFMKAQSSGALASACTLIGDENVVRINPNPDWGDARLDALHLIPELVALGRAEAEAWFARLDVPFLSAAAEPFTPCHGPAPVSA